jgi:N6-L-threonylcarbamoyladenine synthase
MKVLGIETSCDETAVAVVTSEKDILANLVLSQMEHAQFGGVVPEVAARAHLNHIDTMVAEAMEKAGLNFSDLDGIAVTAGPGLIGGVLVGVMTAKAISAVHNIPLSGVNHLEGHALTVRLTDDVAFPYLLLLVSGGHCQLLIVDGVGKYRRVGTTIDDAVGEAFDKTSKLLGLGYPGGPPVEKMASSCGNHDRARKKFPLPRPLMGKPGCDFSFSGLKTSVRRAADALPEELEQEDLVDICFSFQDAVGDVLADRVRNAIAIYKNTCPDAHALVVAGGVAANKALRARLEKESSAAGLRFVAPPLKLCTDNAAMIAWAGLERLRLGLADKIDFPVHARWPLDPDAPIASIKSQKV